MQFINTNQSRLKTSQGMGIFLRSAKSKFPVLLALTAILATATFLRADSDGNQREHTQLAGTWVGNAGSTLAPALASFMADGRVIFSRPVTVQTGPARFELVSAAQGEWVQTGNHEFTSSVVTFRSGQSVEFTGMVKLIMTINLDRTTDQLAVNGTVYIYDAAGNLLIALPQPGIGVFKRIVAGQ